MFSPMAERLSRFTGGPPEWRRACASSLRRRVHGRSRFNSTTWKEGERPLRRGTDCAERHRHARADVRRVSSNPVHGPIRFRTDELVTARSHRGSHASHRGSHATGFHGASRCVLDVRVETRRTHTVSADTSKGVVLLRSMGDAPCLLGRTWGYDQTSVWVSDGCSAEFATGPAGEQERRSPSPSRTFRTSASCSSMATRARCISGCSATRAI